MPRNAYANSLIYGERTPKGINDKGQEIAQKLVVDIPLLLKAAQNLANQLGWHAKKQSGSGDDFWQYRPYEQGESASRIDWRQSAKSDRNYVKQKEHQSPRFFQIFALQSERMNWQYDENAPNKRDIGNITCLAIAYALIDIGEKIAIIGEKKPIASKQIFTEKLLLVKSELPQIFQNGIAIIIHDGLSDLTLFENVFNNAIKSGCKIILINIHDKNEMEFIFEGRIEFNDINGNQKILIENCEAVQSQFIEKYQNHFKALKELAKKYDFPIFDLLINDDIFTQILPIWQSALSLEGQGG